MNAIYAAGIACVAIFLGLCVLTAVWSPRNQEQWIREMNERCLAVNGHGTYLFKDGTLVFECWQKSKRVFVEVFI